MIPLKQWRCDTCGGIIKGADQGYLEWISDKNHRAHSFRIVHQAVFAPNNIRDGGGYGEGCYQYGKQSGAKDVPLTEFVDENGLTNLLSFLDIGYIDPKDGGPWIKSP
jgi:hypothetical protein